MRESYRGVFYYYLCSLLVFWEHEWLFEEAASEVTKRKKMTSIAFLKLARNRPGK
jgi:hypothetical protein